MCGGKFDNNFPYMYFGLLLGDGKIQPLKSPSLPVPHIL